MMRIALKMLRIAKNIHRAFGFIFPIFVCSKPQEIMQTVTIPEQEYLQMKQTIQALQQQLNLLQDKEFMQVFMLVNQEIVQENKAEKERKNL
jgi:hypothetical protein